MWLCQYTLNSKARRFAETSLPEKVIISRPFESKPQICQNMIIEDGCEKSTAAHTPRSNPFGLDLGAALGERSWDILVFLVALTNNEVCIPFLLLQMKCIHSVAILYFAAVVLFPISSSFSLCCHCLVHHFTWICVDILPDGRTDRARASSSI